MCVPMTWPFFCSVSLWQLKIPERKKNTLDIISYKKLYRNTNLRNLTFSLELDITGTNIPQLSYEKFT
jgi:hypothetical protein